HVNLVVDTPQEGFVGQVGGLQVGGEDHHQLERDLKLASVPQREVIDAPVQRNDPAVQQVARRHELAPAVVDQQNAVVGFHLERRRVDARRLVQAQLQHAGN